MCALPDHVEISKQTIRDHAIAFSKKYADAKSEAGERQLFWNDFFDIFGVSLKNVGFFEVAAERLSTKNIGWIDLLYPGQMAVEHKSAGGDLDKAMDQLVDYLPSLQEAAMPRLLVACNFQEFYWKDLIAHTEGRFDLADLSKNVELFWWLAGHVVHEAFADEEEANLVATGYMAKIHDAVLASNYDPHALREWLTRILFCLFADDTEVWDRNAFSNYLFLNTRPDGSDLGSVLGYIFQILNTPADKRATNLDEDLAAFTYINGDVFETVLPIPSCDEATRTALLDACKFDWSAISPAIFGSMFQNVMTSVERRHLGAHYTTEENILKTIRPLFLDALEEELTKAKSKKALNDLHTKLAGFTFLDPACGCGNFLVIAYRELRRIESAILRKLRAREGVDSQRQAIGLELLCKVTVGQFYGIEIEEFPARIARTALYLMDHKANLEVSKEFGQYFARFPIPTSPHIAIENALRIDWNDVLPADEASFVFGNPPFIGMSLMSAEQQEDNRLVFGGESGTSLRTGRLDYVACWYAKTMAYVGTRPIHSAYVSTNSVSQGEQARALAGLFARHGFTVAFCHRTFAWTSEAKGTAHVHVVIIGFAPLAHVGVRKLFEYERLDGPSAATTASHINAYLVDAPDILIGKHARPFIPLPIPTEGNRPEDAGGLILSNAEAKELKSAHPELGPHIRRLLGARDMMRGETRWCLWFPDGLPKGVGQIPEIKRRLSLVRQAREESITKTRSVQRKEKMAELARTPYRFAAIRQPAKGYLCIPRHSSELRRVVPMTLVSQSVIAHDSTLTIDGAQKWLFAILQSAMFASWVRTVCGRLKSDIRIAPDLAFTAFPFPSLDEAAKKKLTKVADSVLDARTANAGWSLADLYDPLSMPAALVRAHDQLDKVVDSLFAPRKRFRNDAERLTILFERYEALTSPLLASR